MMNTIKNLEHSTEKVEMNVAGLFWTKTDEMVEDLEELGYYVEDVNEEYVVVNDGNDLYIMYLGHANKTMWVQKVSQIED